MRFLALLMCGVLVGLTLDSGPARAAWKREHGATCYPVSLVGYTSYQESNGLANTSTVNQTYICPYNEDSVIPRTSLTTLNVHGLQAAGAASSASLCLKTFVSGAINVGFRCDPAATTTGAGIYTLQPVKTAWQNMSFATEYGYVKMNLTPGSSLFGIYAAF
ncbi:MAG: hypothetical protein Q8K32_12240 [Archangium sp.]|nr:hypothetical protein [Archangium sp.]